MSESILELEYRPGEEVVLRFRPPKVPALSPEAREHFRTARREFLLALRSLIDAAIETLEKREEPKGRTKIEVE